MGNSSALTSLRERIAWAASTGIWKDGSSKTWSSAFAMGFARAGRPIQEDDPATGGRSGDAAGVSCLSSSVITRSGHVGSYTITS